MFAYQIIELSAIPSAGGRGVLSGWLACVFLLVQGVDAFLEMGDPSVEFCEQVQVEQAGVLSAWELERVDFRL